MFYRLPTESGTAKQKKNFVNMLRSDPHAQCICFTCPFALIQEYTALVNDPFGDSISHSNIKFMRGIAGSNFTNGNCGINLLRDCLPLLNSLLPEALQV